MEQKTALVTGANRGIGLEISRQLAQQGMHVWLGVRDEIQAQPVAHQLQAEGLSVALLPLDITDPVAVAAAGARLAQHSPCLDVLVNNAAMQTTDRQLPSAITPELLHQFLETNYVAHVRLTQTLLPLLRCSLAGRIVNMSTSLGSVTLMSEPGHVNARRNLLGYSSAKAALNMFTVLLAKELKDTPIKVNSADPGWTRTALGGDEAPQLPAQAAQVAVWLATLDERGPTGSFFSATTTNPW
jgi:NAD(P)-dependent dehydrogenase (short-subunit alcohol dehydrogenase family)